VTGQQSTSAKQTSKGLNALSDQGELEVPSFEDLMDEDGDGSLAHFVLTDNDQ